MTTKTKKITDYIGKNAVKIQKTDSTAYAISPDILATSQAMTLAQLFEGVAGRKGYTGRSKHLQHLSHFITLVQRLGTMRERGVHVKNIDFLLAQKWYYGASVEPWHLITPQSQDIYMAYMRQKNTPTVVFSTEDYAEYDAETIAFLSDVRGETANETREMMTACGFL